MREAGRILKSAWHTAEQSAQHFSKEWTSNAAQLSRRCFLQLGIFVAAVFTSDHSLGHARDPACRERSLTFYNTHTGESLKTSYWSEGRYVPESLADINYILRDHRTDEIKTIDPRLLDLLYVVRLKLSTSNPYHIISGYRSLRTNAFLCKHDSGVARNSLHVCGKAADVRLSQIDLSMLHRVAMGLKKGGVGYYPKSDFVHIDIGPVRHW